MKRGEVYWASIAPRSGSEQQGTRPVIIVSHDGFNETPGWRSVIVVPVSTTPAQAKRGPMVVPLQAGSGAAMGFYHRFKPVTWGNPKAMNFAPFGSFARP